MSKRTEALWRAVALLWAWTIGGLIAGVVMFIGAILGIVDIILQLVLGSDAISRTGMSMTAVAESVMWWADVHVYAFTGKGDGFNWIPSLS